MGCHQPVSQSPRRPTAPLGHPVEGDPTCHAEGGRAGLHRHRCACECSAGPRPVRPARRPVASACLWEADGKPVAAGLAAQWPGPSPPRAELSWAAQAGSRRGEDAPSAAAAAGHGLCVQPVCPELRLLIIIQGPHLVASKLPWLRTREFHPRCLPVLRPPWPHSNCCAGPQGGALPGLAEKRVVTRTTHSQGQPQLAGT